MHQNFPTVLLALLGLAVTKSSALTCYTAVNSAPQSCNASYCLISSTTMDLQSAVTASCDVNNLCASMDQVTNCFTSNGLYYLCCNEQDNCNGNIENSCVPPNRYYRRRRNRYYSASSTLSPPSFYVYCFILAPFFLAKALLEV